MPEYIEREALLQVLEELGGWDDPPDLWAEGYAWGTFSALRRVEDQPTADVQGIKHGEWKSFNSEDTLYGSYYCSACGHGQDIGMVIPLTTEFKYCPNCGAKMDGGT